MVKAFEVTKDYRSDTKVVGKKIGNSRDSHTLIFIYGFGAIFIYTLNKHINYDHINKRKRLWSFSESESVSFKLTYQLFYKSDKKNRLIQIKAQIK